MIFYFIYLILVFFCSLIMKKKGLFLNYTGENHQSFSNKGNVPLSGGIFILVPLIFFSLNNFFLSFFTISIFLIGFFSDRKVLVSPQKRFVFQSTLVLLFVIIFDLRILSSRIELFDILLNNKIFGYIFSAFCLLILINGKNFIDGLNGLVIFYSIVILYFLTNLGFINYSIISDQAIYLILLLLGLLFLLNIFNVLMLGDSGAYLLGFFLGYIIISSHIYNPNVSPYFFISLLWYPCYENLFSIIRKLKKKLSPLKPDSKHLHQLVFFYTKKKFNLSLLYSNNLSSILICFFNFLIVFICSLNPYSTVHQIKLIFVSVILYNVFYFLLNKFYKLNFKSEK